MNIDAAINHDIFLGIIALLDDPRDFINWCLVSRKFYEWARAFGWHRYRKERRIEEEIPGRSSRSWLEDAHRARTEIHRKEARFEARDETHDLVHRVRLDRSWRHARSSVALAHEHLIVGCGHVLAWRSRRNIDTNDAEWQTWIFQRDIMQVEWIRGTGEVLIAFEDGFFLQTSLHSKRSSHRHRRKKSKESAIAAGGIFAMAQHPPLFAFVSRNDQLDVFLHPRKGDSQHRNIASLPLRSRPWAVEFLGASNLAVGCTGNDIMSVYDVKNSQVVPQPSRHYVCDAMDICASATYAIKSLSAAEFASGMFEGGTRVHDMRLPVNTDIVQTFRDAVDDTAVYSLACDGHRIFAGSCRNSVVRVFDRRYARGHYSCFASPRRSPVFDLVVDNARVFVGLESSVALLHFNAGSDHGSHYWHKDWI